VFKRSLVVLVVALLAATAAVLAAAAPPAAPTYPHRIVSLSPTATESLFAIGAGPQVIAVDDQSNYPKSAPRSKLSGFTPNIEAIAKYRPDLVVVSNDIKGVVAALKRLKIPVLLQPAVSTLTGTYAEILQLGKVTGHVAGAARLVASMRSRIAKLVAAAPRSLRQVSVYHELTPDYYSATSKTFIGRVYALFGLRNIADAADSSGSGYPQLSGEYILQANPDLIVLADTVCCDQTPATVAARPGWQGIAAVQAHAIVRIDDSIASRWGPRVVNFVQAVSSALRTTAR